MMALRERGLAAISAADGLIRSSALSFMALGAANGERRSNHLARIRRDELFDHAVFQRMETDHDQPASRLKHIKAGL
jgi:hypothetical protein